MTSTRTTYEVNIEARYVVVIRGTLILSVALAASRSDADRMVAPYNGDQDVVTSIKALPMTPSQGQDISELLEAMTKTVVHVAWSDTVRAELSRHAEVAGH